MNIRYPIYEGVYRILTKKTESVNLKVSIFGRGNLYLSPPFDVTHFC
jgi:hypothetical protein